MHLTFANGKHVFWTSAALPGRQNACSGIAFLPSRSSSSDSLNDVKFTSSKGPIAKPIWWGAIAVLQVKDVVFLVESFGSTILYMLALFLQRAKEADFVCQIT